MSRLHRALVWLTLLWLAGFGLRLTLLAVPPIIPQLRNDLGLSQTGVGVLSGLPVLIFAVASLPGSLLIARYGAAATLIGGLVVGAIGSALRGAAPDVGFFYVATALMAFGIAIMQPALPPLVREWLPARVSFATALYTNGLLIGEVAPVALSIPFVLPLVGGSWRWDLVIWSIPLAVIGLLVACAPRQPRTAEIYEIAPPRRWWPDWRDPRLWRLGPIFGANTSAYFGANAFLPDYLVTFGRGDLITGALTALNLAQIPASVLILLFGRHFDRRHWPLVSLGLIGAAGLLGIMYAPVHWILLFAGVIGFACAGALSLALALPALLSEPEDVPRMAAGSFTIGYSLALLLPVISGALWDLTGIPRMAFLPIVLCSLLLSALAASLDLKARLRPS